MSCKPQKLFWLSFCTTLLIIFFLSLVCINIKNRNLFLKAENRIPKVFSNLPTTWFEGKIHSPEKAKMNQLFWFDNEKVESVALKVLENPILFKEVFPGYEELRSKFLLWQRYFARKFDAVTWLPSLSGIMGSGSVFTATIGCIDLFFEAGADVVFFGTSEVYRGVIPDLISAQIKQSTKFSNPKILMCTSGFLLTNHIKEMAEAMSHSKHKAKIIVLGYSFWDAFTRSSERKAMEVEKKKGFAALKIGWHENKLAYYFPQLDWEKLIPLTREKLKDVAHDPAPVREKIKTDNPGVVETLFIKKSVSSNEVQLLELAHQKNGKSSYHMFNDIKESDCNLDEARKILSNTISELKKVSEKMIIYIPPTTPLHHNLGPSCFLKNVKAMLESLRSENVKVITDSWSEYGLKYSDHLYDTNDPDVVRVDFNHTNYDGAIKVTKRIGKQVTEGLR